MVEKNLRNLIKKRLKLLLLFHPIPSKHVEESELCLQQKI